MTHQIKVIPIITYVCLSPMSRRSTPGAMSYLWTLPTPPLLTFYMHFLPVYGVSSVGAHVCAGVYVGGRVGECDGIGGGCA